MSFDHRIAAWLIAGAPLVAAAGDCAPQPGCQVPGNCAPPVYCCPPGDRGAPRDAPGNYVRGPATGEARGESNSVGIRGLRLRIPEINLQLPSIELPSLYSIRREAEMVFDSTRGPYVEGQPAEFRMVPGEDRGGDDKGGPGETRCAPPAGFVPAGMGNGEGHNVPSPVPMPPAPMTPASESAAYRHRELELREQEVALLRQQVQEMQAMLRDMSASSSATTPGTNRSVETVEAPRPAAPVTVRPRRVEPAAYTEDDGTEAATPGFGLSQPTRAASKPAVPPPSRPVPRTTKTSTAPRTASSSFGDWAAEDR